MVVTNTDAQSGTLNNGYTYTVTNPAPTVLSITPEQRDGERRNACDHYRHRLPARVPR